MAKLIRTRPLAELGAGAQPADTAADLSLSEVPYRGLVNLRLNAQESRTHLELLSASLGVKLPLSANTVTDTEHARCLWLGPDEWLLISKTRPGPEFASEISETLGSVHHSAKDVSDNYTSMRLSGAKARDVLSKLTPFDIHQSIFTAGQCAQTVMAKSSVILDMIEDEDGHAAFEITLRRSFAAYVWERVQDAGGEFDLIVKEFS